MSFGEVFGETGTGEPVRRVILRGGGLTANVLSFGAILQDLRLEGHEPPLMLGFERFEDYLAHPNYFGAVIGRHANRIRNGRFGIDGKGYAIDPEHPERHGLHGGPDGYARRNWTVDEAGEDFVTLSLADPDGLMGFPGALATRCTYRLGGEGALSLTLTATADKPTLCNLTSHAYFNLEDGGETDTGDHQLAIFADAYLPVDGDLIPTGAVTPVAGTDFDFREPRKIRPMPEADLIRYDNNFCLSSARREISLAARAQAGKSGVEMEVWTTEPGVQFYAGHYVDLDAIGLGGRRYRPFSSFCLEAQIWPDSPNQPYFPQAVLRPGETYRHVTEFRFRCA
ncbi:aldose epimerase family protein [Mesorhizobium sp. LHD-90]|uniref:aldose epimerase family protein n=1 Tax=Mesorhizobium sp. LHD-90 TaxID=3071414 RepID=UPI0027E20DFB|nr:aldose epimerase family protein [Mesorhizobium sp. LHD-90]MDQ6433158.1 aldose epimerase family protein [Mesorhizobium sp. LHD-90]